MTNEELKKMLEEHLHWIRQDCEGWDKMHADLRGLDLSGANLKDANLRGASLMSVDLMSADFRDADLRGAYLKRAYLGNANFSNANLRDVDLSGTFLQGAVFTNADLHYANLSEADLRGSDLSGADLSGANLWGAKLFGAILWGAKGVTLGIACPDEGEFVAWKKAQVDGELYSCIVKLKIPYDAKRLSATTRKCRTNKAVVIGLETLDGKPYPKDAIAHSLRDPNFLYKVGDTLVVENFDENRWNECSTGIHFFVSRDDARHYHY